MNLFNKIEDGVVHLYSRGVTKQVTLHELGGVLYARHGSGYIKLRKGGGTSVGSITWTDLHAGDFEIEQGIFNITLKKPVALAAE